MSDARVARGGGEDTKRQPSPTTPMQPPAPAPAPQRPLSPRRPIAAAGGQYERPVRPVQYDAPVHHGVLLGEAVLEQRLVGARDVAEALRQQAVVAQEGALLVVWWVVGGGGGWGGGYGRGGWGVFGGRVEGIVGARFGRWGLTRPLLGAPNGEGQEGAR